MKDEERRVVDGFVASWCAELAALADPEHPDPLDVLRDRVPETIGWCDGYDDWSEHVLAELAAYTTRWLDARRAEEATWHEPTVNDRIGAAFTALAAEDLVALSHAGVTIEDGWACVGLALRDVEAPRRGAVFFHQEDVIDALEGRSMALAFGAFERGAAHERIARDVGERVVDVLERHGVSTDWSGSPRDRIELAPFPWRARRFTRAPEVRLVSRQARLALGTAAPVHGAWRADARFTREEAIQPVFAKYDTFAIDLDLSARMRGAWTLYAGGRGHTHHHGLPHTFVPAGEETTFWPGPALANLSADEARVWWERGAES